ARARPSGTSSLRTSKGEAKPRRPASVAAGLRRRGSVFLGLLGRDRAGGFLARFVGGAGGRVGSRGISIFGTFRRLFGGRSRQLRTAAVLAQIEHQVGAILGVAEAREAHLRAGNHAFR